MFNPLKWSTNVQKALEAAVEVFENIDERLKRLEQYTFGEDEEEEKE